jgi:D-methionine transport system ATP-binding protein
VPLLELEGVSLVSRLVATSSRGALPANAHYLLQNISFQVAAGDRIALVGPSGSGKTSLLRVLNRLSEPISGQISLQGQVYSQLPVVSLRQQVVLVLQESKLLGMTVQQALEYPLKLRTLPASQVKQRVGEWMARLNIPEDWLPRTELQLSVGQRQLVAIARALVTQPQILLLDEPTSALDVGRSQNLLKILTELSDHHQLTILMANHQLEMAQQFCTRVLYLEQGNLVEDLPANHVQWNALKTRLLEQEAKQVEDW